MQPTKVEFLRAGDQFAYRAGVVDVLAVQVVDSRRNPRVAVTVDIPSGSPVEMVNLRGDVITHRPYRTVMYPPGHIVDADCQVRS